MTLLLYRLIFVVTLLIDNDIAIIQTDFWWRCFSYNNSSWQNQCIILQETGVESVEEKVRQIIDEDVPVSINNIVVNITKLVSLYALL